MKEIKRSIKTVNLNMEIQIQQKDIADTPIAKHHSPYPNPKRRYNKYLR
jgi:hypothetical protein